MNKFETFFVGRNYNYNIYVYLLIKMKYWAAKTTNQNFVIYVY